MVVRNRGRARRGARHLLVLAALSASVALVGCTSSTTTYFAPDMAVHIGPDLAPVACQTGARQCIGTNLYEVCDTGGVWGADQPCAPGTTCQNGTCSPNAIGMQPCTAGTAQCVPGMSNMVLTCRAAGTGYDATTCPANTQCANGVCVGGCGAVGSATCSNNATQINTCDGNVITTTSCPANQLCVMTANGNAACLPADCNPTTACTVCGNPTISSIDPGSTVSNCQATTLGYKWVTSKCAAPNGVCDPHGGGSCGAFGNSFNAACSAAVGAVCTPGQTRCYRSNGAAGVETCNAQGQWSAPAYCTGQQVCLNTPTGTAVCGDPACAQGGATGACVLSGNTEQIRTCVNGQLAPSPVPCATGICVAITGPLGDNTIAGSCQPQCKAGESRCQGALVQSCAANGTWGTISACASGSCYPSTAAITNLRTTVCGTCQPGTHQCINSNGGFDGGVNGSGLALQTCLSNGVWDEGTVCPVGVCTPFLNDASCVAGCVPNQPVCIGPQADAPAGAGPNEPGATVASLTCTANGTIPPFNPGGCPASGADGGCCQPVGGQVTSCRHNQANQALGCVVCVPGNNEWGIGDTRCTDTTGTNFPGTPACNGSNCLCWGPNWSGPAATATEICQATPDGIGTWSTPSPCNAGMDCVIPWQSTPASCSTSNGNSFCGD